MIVCLTRPVEPPVGPWLLYAPGGVRDFITPTPDLVRKLDGLKGYFEAQPLPDGEGWDIGERVEDPQWRL